MVGVASSGEGGVSDLPTLVICYIRQMGWELPILARVGYLSLFSVSKGVLSAVYFPGSIKASGDTLIFQM